MNKFEFLDLVDEALFVLNIKDEIIFKNKSCIRNFGNFSDLNKIKNYFNFDTCFLNTENIANTTPIDLALASKENFFCFCYYEKSKDDLVYVNLYSIRYRDFLVIILKDVSADVYANELSNELKQQINCNLKLKEELEKFSKLNKEAQEQALKMAILNRLSASIRESNDISTIINSALTEINNLIGGYKAYFIVAAGKKFKIKFSSTKSDKHINSFAMFDNDTLEQIKLNKISIMASIKEFTDSKTTLKSGSKRLILPIYHHKTLLGAIIAYTTHKISIEDNHEICEYVSQLLSNALIQSELILELNKKNKKLQKAINEIKDIQLQLINSEKLASVGQLVAGVAHEINTPIASINSNNSVISKLLSKDCLTENDYKMIKEIIAIDRNAIERISNIVVSLKRFVRLDESERQQADINKELDLTLKIINYDIKNKINIIKNYSELPPVYCYVNMLNQVFMNLLVNACHSFDTNTKSPTITITTSIDNETLIVKIKDNGRGIPKKNQKHIFEAGFTTKLLGVGTGLGLAICNKIIALHKGQISFTSEVNIGTEFIIRIPIY